MRQLGPALLTILVTSGAAAAPRETEISFPTPDIRPSASFDRSYDEGPMLTLRGRLTLPDGTGPFPAVVHLHTCAGSVPALDNAWTKRFVEWGFAVLRLDSLGPRSLTSVCDWRASLLPLYSRAGDAYAAKEWLSQRHEIDHDRIIVAGWSHGGSTVLTALGARPTEFGARAETTPFMAGIAFYPFCVAPNEVQAPILILIGEADTWTPASQCRAMGRNEKIRIEFYQDATHAFDSPGADLVMEGHKIRHDPAAETSAIKAVQSFLHELMR